MMIRKCLKERGDVAVIGEDGSCLGAKNALAMDETSSPSLQVYHFPSSGLTRCARGDMTK